jgi:hypothetical protein
MAIELPRRGFLIGLAGLIAAPAIIRLAPLMRVRALPLVVRRSEKPEFRTLYGQSRVAISVAYGTPSWIEISENGGASWRALAPGETIRVEADDLGRYTFSIAPGPDSHVKH